MWNNSTQPKSPQRSWLNNWKSPNGLVRHEEYLAWTESEGLNGYSSWFPLSRSGEDSSVLLMPSYCYCVAFSLGEKTGAGHPLLTVDLMVPLQSNKVPVVQPSHAVHPLTPLITYSDEHFSPGSHPSHIPSDVNSKQGESPALPGLFQLGRNRATSALGPYQGLCSLSLSGSKWIVRGQE